MRTSFLALLALACLAGCPEPVGSGASGVAPVASGTDWLSGTTDERFAKVSKHLRGLDVAMAEVGYRYGELHWAGEDRNWGYARYQLDKIELALANGVERRPKRAASARVMDGPAKEVARAIQREDQAAFRAAFETLTATCNTCHRMEHVPFVTVAPPAVRDSPVRWKAPAGFTVFLVRHGQAVKNVPHPEGLSEEELDRLTDAGRAQASAAAAFLRGRATRVLHSPTGRTRATAAAITEALGVAPVETSAFASVRDGTTPDGARTDWSWRVKRWKEREDPRPEGGESLEDGTRRALGAIEALARGEGALVIVTHGDVVAALLGHASATPVPERWERHQVPEGSISELVLEGGTWRVARAGFVPER